IVAQALTNQPPDVEHFVPMMEQVIENCGVPRYATADAGYFSEENIVRAEQLGIDVYIPGSRDKHGESPPPVRGRPPKGMTLKQRMQRRLATKKGRARYARRKAVAEPPFGQTKHARGFRQLLLRGLEKAAGEWALICLTHPLLTLHRAATASVVVSWAGMFRPAPPSAPLRLPDLAGFYFNRLLAPLPHPGHRQHQQGEGGVVPARRGLRIDPQQPREVRSPEAGEHCAVDLREGLLTEVDHERPQR